jgi:outer membrane protein assembly factor BamB
VKLWFADNIPQVDMFTPAIDDVYAYAYAGGQLNIIDRRNGNAVSIGDPNPDTFGYSHLAATILSNSQRVISFSGDSFSGRASSSTGGYYSRSLISFDLASRSLEWRTESQYITQPALANGLLYAGSSESLQIDAISEDTGQVVWSWIPEDGSTQFCRNIIATDSHLFVSTDIAVHAINLKTHKSIWSIAIPGELALSSKGTLIINEGCRESTGKMMAVKLVQ